MEQRFQMATEDDFNDKLYEEQDIYHEYRSKCDSDHQKRSTAKIIERCKQIVFDNFSEHEDNIGGDVEDKNVESGSDGNICEEVNSRNTIEVLFLRKSFIAANDVI